MGAQPIRLHGVTHEPNVGSDPIPGIVTGWQFDFANEGGWGQVDFRDWFGFGGYAGDLGLLFQDFTRKGMMLLALDPDTLVPAPQPTYIKVVEGNISLVSLTAAAGTVEIGITDNGVTVQLGTGTMFQVLDHFGNPAFEVRDDGSVHILTGTSVIADL